MAFTTVVPELGTYFTQSFSKMLINHIYNKWSTTTGNLAKPASMEGQTNLIEFKRGFPSEFKSLSVTAVQGITQVREYLQFGQKIVSMQTQVIVTLRVNTMGLDDPDDVLSKMEEELENICFQYQQNQSTGNMAGIKDLIYEQGRREYMPSDSWDKSEWMSAHSIQMWYQLSDVQ